TLRRCSGTPSRPDRIRRGSRARLEPRDPRVHREPLVSSRPSRTRPRSTSKRAYCRVQKGNGASAWAVTEGIGLVVIAGTNAVPSTEAVSLVGDLIGAGRRGGAHEWSPEL